MLVTVTDGNRAPFFNDGTSTTREIPENAGQGASVGSPVAATDLNTGDTLTYTLDDPSGLFEIDGKRPDDRKNHRSACLAALRL